MPAGAAQTSQIPPASGGRRYSCVLWRTPLQGEGQMSTEEALACGNGCFDKQVQGEGPPVMFFSPGFFGVKTQTRGERHNKSLLIFQKFATLLSIHQFPAETAKYPVALSLLSHKVAKCCSVAPFAIACFSYTFACLIWSLIPAGSSGCVVEGIGPISTSHCQ